MIVELAAARDVASVEVAANSGADDVALFRLDRDVRSKEATAVERLVGRTATFTASGHVRFAVELRKGDSLAAGGDGRDRAGHRAQRAGDAATRRRAGGPGADVDFLVVDGTAFADAGPALAEALDRPARRPGPAAGGADLVVRSHAPCTLAITDLAVTARLEASTFRLRRADAGRPRRRARARVRTAALARPGQRAPARRAAGRAGRRAARRGRRARARARARSAGRARRPPPRRRALRQPPGSPPSSSPRPRSRGSTRPRRATRGRR